MKYFFIYKRIAQLKTTFVFNMAKYVKNASTITCVSYKDRFSVNLRGFDNMLIGFNKGIVSCNEKKWNTMTKGDIAIVTCKLKNKRYFYVCMLTERIDEPFNGWLELGGTQWEYNFRCVPLTGIEVIDYEKTEKCCKSSNVNIKNIFNMRFCSNRVRNALIQMFKSNTYFRKYHHSYK